MSFRKNNYSPINYLFLLLLVFAGCNTSQTSNEKNEVDTVESILPGQDSIITISRDSPAVSSITAEEKSKSASTLSPSIDGLSYTIIPGNDKTFGYDIYKDNRLI